MKRTKRKKISSWVFLFSCSFLTGFLFPVYSRALGPMHAYHDLVAGQGDPGLKDGFFADAQFHSPAALAASSDGVFLYVADQDNHCIRAIDLTRQNDVSTLVGGKEAGHQDGAFATASFNKPYRIVELSPGRLLVYDVGDESFRLLDLSQKTVSTLVRSGDKEAHGHSLSRLDELAWDPSSKFLYFTQSALNALSRLDLKTHEVQVLLDHSPQMPHPRAVCLWQEHLLVADPGMPSVFQVDIPSQGQTLVTLTEKFKGQSVISLIPCGKNIYAYQQTDPPLVCLKPSRTVDFPFVWDIKALYDNVNDYPKPEYWFPFKDEPPVCFISDPREQGSFLVAMPSRNEIVSFRDVGYVDSPVQGISVLTGFRTFGHPITKPKGVIRILVVVDPLIDSGPLPAGSEPSHVFPLLATVSQRLELALNTCAALNGWKSSFEVMAFDGSGPLSSIAKNCDIDFVLCLESSTHSLPAPDWVKRTAEGWQKAGRSSSTFRVVFLPGTEGVALPSIEEERSFWMKFCGGKNIPFWDLTRAWTSFRPSFFPLAEEGPQPKLNVKGVDLLGWLLARQLVIRDFTPDGALKSPSVDTSAMEPLSQFQDLVAGEGTAGFRDGDFASALFNAPTGLALNADGTDLFVADSGNHRIRAVHLNQSNIVDTLAGNGESGNQDGAFNQSSFEQPTLLAAVPNGLLIYDAQSRLLREIDLKFGKVSTLALKEKGKSVEPERLAGVFNMAYDAPSDTLYLSEPAQGRLDQVSLKTLELTGLLEKDPRSPQPAALTLFQGKLYLSDLVLPGIRAMKTMGSPEEKKSSLIPMWNSPLASAMGAAGDRLYALGGTPLSFVRLQPEEKSLMMSLWNNFFNPVSFDFQAFCGEKNNEPLGLLAGVEGSQRLFLASPSLNQVFSLADYDFKTFESRDSRLPDGLTDFQYPARKPVRTFRILIAGDSHVFRNDLGNNNMENLAKRLQMFLNAEAALEGTSTHFEVLNFAFGNSDDNPLFLWPYYLVPDAVKKYDIDLVLMGTNPEPYQNFQAYVQRHLTSEGIPAWKTDPEYFLKPLLERVPSGREGDLFRRHMQKTGDKVALDVMDLPTILFNEKDRADIGFLYGKPIALLHQKLSSLRTSQGQPVALGMFFFPAGSHGNLALVEPFRDLWRDVAGTAGIPYLDLAAPFTALRQSYFPVAEFTGTFHPTSGGYFFKAYLLAHALIQDKMVPFQSH